MYLAEIKQGAPVQSGWADPRLGEAYELIAAVLQDRASDWHRHPLLAQIEQADINLSEGLEP